MSISDRWHEILKGDLFQRTFEKKSPEHIQAARKEIRELATTGRLGIPSFTQANVNEIMERWDAVVDDPSRRGLFFKVSQVGSKAQIDYQEF